MLCVAAIQFDDGQDIDELVAEFVGEQRAQGFRVKGVLQTRGQAGGECFCSEMYLHAIGCDQVFRISQPLGRGSSGCRLHYGELAKCSAFLEREIEAGADLLVLNRFGKGESEGRGLRDLITAALAAGIPVLIAVRPTYLAAWQHFSGNCGIKLPFDKVAIQDWFRALRRDHAA